MGRFPSGQREQTVNLPSQTSMVRIHPCPPFFAGMAELADALDSGSSESNFMQVQVLFPAPTKKARQKRRASFFANRETDLKKPQWIKPQWGLRTALTERRRAARIQSCFPHQTSIIRTRFSKSEMGSDFFLPSTTIILKTADGEGLLPSAERDNPP